MTARPQTAIGAALGRAGFNAIEARLRQVILDALRKHHRNIPRTLETVEHATEDDPELIREALLWAVCSLDNEMLGAGHSVNDIHASNAGAQQTNGDVTGQVLSSTNGQAATAGASPTNRGGADLQSSAPHVMSVRPVREPSIHDRAAAGRIARTITLTIFDSFKVRDGRGIGDVRWGQLKSLRSTDLMSASVIDQLMKHTQAPHDTRVRDAVKASDLQRMIQRAAEVADAA